MVSQEKLYTSADLWELSHLPENDGKRLLLLEGELYEMTPTGWKHGDVASELDVAIGSYVKAHKLGRVTAAETGYDLAPGTTLAPDVGFVAAGGGAGPVANGFVSLPPGLAREGVLARENSPG